MKTEFRSLHEKKFRCRNAVCEGYFVGEAAALIESMICGIGALHTAFSDHHDSYPYRYADRNECPCHRVWVIPCTKVPTRAVIARSAATRQSVPCLRLDRKYEIAAPSGLAMTSALLSIAMLEELVELKSTHSETVADLMFGESDLGRYPGTHHLWES